MICVFSVIVVIYVICAKRPHQFLRTVGILRETSSVFTNVGSEKVCSNVKSPLYNGNNIMFVDVTQISPAM